MEATLKQDALSVTIVSGGPKGCMISLETKSFAISTVAWVVALARAYPLSCSTRISAKRCPVPDSRKGPAKSMEKVEKRLARRSESEVRYLGTGVTCWQLAPDRTER